MSASITRDFVFGLFFIFGGITSLNDVLIPKLKELFTLNYTQAMLVQFCFFTAYLVIGIPGAKLVKKLGIESDMESYVLSKKLKTLISNEQGICSQKRYYA